jgi:putative ABC transport system permease protein
LQHAGADSQHAGVDLQYAGADLQHAGADLQHVGADLQHAGMEAVSIASQSPVGADHSAVSLSREDANGQNDAGCHVIYADWGYTAVFRLRMAHGSYIPATRTVWGEGGGEETFYLILNETAANRIGMTDVFSKTVSRTKVAGVAKDFHFRSFHEKITPLMIRYGPEISDKVFVRVRPDNMKETLGYIREVFLKFKTDNPFEYFFVDDEYRNMYQKEFRLGQLFLYFSLLSIFISCMGVFSLVAFMVEYRSKEIAIRKISGASASDVVRLFAGEFSALTVAAFVAASAFAWFAMNRWLQTFQYNAGIGWWIFAGALALSWSLTLIALVVQVYRAARRNPVVSLKNE